MAWQAVAAAVAAGTYVLSGMAQADAIRNQAETTKKFNDLNADLMDIDAYEAEKFGYTESARYESIVNGVLSDQRLAFAAQDVDATYGTAADVQQESKVNGFLNVLDIKKAAREKAKGIRSAAENLRLQGRLGINQAGVNAGAATASGFAGAAQVGASYYSGGAGGGKAK